EGEVIDGQVGLAGRRERPIDEAAYRRARRACAEAVVSQRHVRVRLFWWRGPRYDRRLLASCPSRVPLPPFPLRGRVSEAGCTGASTPFPAELLEAGFECPRIKSGGNESGPRTEDST